LSPQMDHQITQDKQKEKAHIEQIWKPLVAALPPQRNGNQMKVKFMKAILQRKDKFVYKK